MSDDEKQALIFLGEVSRRAKHYADRIDPLRRRDYEKNGTLKALDAIWSAADHRLITLPSKMRAWVK